MRRRLRVGLLLCLLIMASVPAAPTMGAEPLPAQCLSWGVLAPSWGTDLRELDAVEAAVGAPVNLFGFYQGWASGEPFDRARAEAVTARGAMPVLAWEPYDWLADGPDQPAFALRRIIRGDHDDYIRSWARDIKAWGKPLMLRFAYEMNGDWFPWAEAVNGNRPGEYVAAWRHVHDLFTAEGVHNVSWVWAPNIAYSGSTPLAGLYPGNGYVDWLGVSGYNWGVGVTPWHSWQTFEEIFDDTLDQLRALATKPIIITETASAESGGDKAAWIRDLFPALRKHPDVAAITWFNYDKETDWRIQSSPAATKAFAESLQGEARLCGNTSADAFVEIGRARTLVKNADGTITDSLAPGEGG